MERLFRYVYVCAIMYVRLFVRVIMCVLIGFKAVCMYVNYVFGYEIGMCKIN